MLPRPTAEPAAARTKTQRFDHMPRPESEPDAMTYPSEELGKHSTEQIPRYAMSLQCYTSFLRAPRARYQLQKRKTQ